MTCGNALKSALALLVLWTGIAMSARSVLYAQAHAPAPDPPDTSGMVLPQDRMTNEERDAANPCRRFRDLLKDRDTWRRLAWLAMCVQRVRSETVSRAWDRGLDEHGMKLEADALPRKIIEMEIWLRRLPGKYRIEGRYWNSGGSSPLHGTAECFGVGSGPGASCVIATEWKAPKETYKDPYLDENLHDAMRGLVFLFGADPGSQRIRGTLMDFRAIGMSGFVDEGTVMFEGRPNFENLNPGSSPLVTYSWPTSFVTTKPGGDLTMKLLVRAAPGVARGSILFDMQLHRERPADAGRSPTKP
jgi:hypothetical protein